MSEFWIPLFVMLGPVAVVCVLWAFVDYVRARAKRFPTSTPYATPTRTKRDRPISEVMPCAPNTGGEVFQCPVNADRSKIIGGTHHVVFGPLNEKRIPHLDPQVGDVFALEESWHEVRYNKVVKVRPGVVDTVKSSNEDFSCCPAYAYTTATFQKRFAAAIVCESTKGNMTQEQRVRLWNAIESYGAALVERMSQTAEDPSTTLGQNELRSAEANISRIFDSL